MNLVISELNPVNETNDPIPHDDTWFLVVDISKNPPQCLGFFSTFGAALAHKRKLETEFSRELPKKSPSFNPFR